MNLAADSTTLVGCLAPAESLCPFYSHCQPQPPSALATADACSALWELSAELCAPHLPPELPLAAVRGLRCYAGRDAGQKAQEGDERGRSSTPTPSEALSSEPASERESDRVEGSCILRYEK